MITTLDVETTFVFDKDGKKDPSPYLADNKLVSVGYEDEYVFFHHKDKKYIESSKLTSIMSSPVDFNKLQDRLDKTTLLVGHHIRFDLAWLHESGFEYNGPVYCTMIGEYVLARGMKLPLSLEESAKRRELPPKKIDLIAEYWDNDIGFDEIPMEIVEEYGRGDVETTKCLFTAQQEVYNQPYNSGLIPTRNMMNEFLLVLLDMERNGIYFDKDRLLELQKSYGKEKEELEESIQKAIAHLMGDTPVNINSPEQMSQLIYSRRVKDKGMWAETFNIGTEQRGAVTKPKYRPKMSKKEFEHHVSTQTNTPYKTAAEQCKICKGAGHYKRLTRSGKEYKRLHMCTVCKGVGVIYVSGTNIAGLKQKPLSVYTVADGGFKTNRETLEILARGSKSDSVKQFLGKVTRLGQITTYNDTYIKGVLDNLGNNNILHPKAHQTVTATGRRSMTKPNLHNFPRKDSEFLIRGCVKSRWQGGKILDGDFKTLEFRVAVFLAQDKQGMKDISDDVDTHSFTSKTLTDAGQETNRQNAKPHTFKPLYGGTSGTDAERTYYKAFLKKYKDIADWHERLQNDAVNTSRIILPSGREYSFPYARRTKWGGSTYKTQIVNYPVQGFATADITPVAIIEVHRLMKLEKVKSLLILEVHDDCISDVFPGEQRIMIEIYHEGMGNVVKLLKDRYGIDMNIPIETEFSIGDNWIDMETVV